MGVEGLDKIFNPRRIAVVGASNEEGSVGARLLRNLVGVGYRGAVYPVNPFEPNIQGITAYPTIERIPRQVDLAIVATPAHTVPQIVEECGRAGVSGLVIISAGFKEAGEEGKRLESEILKIKGHYRLRIIGPNCLGIMRPSIKLNATFAKRTIGPGKIAFISQSAALCASVLDWASEAHIGFSAVVSVGSMADVDFGDLIDYFGTDPKTKSIMLYMESVKNARNFMSAARGFARAKPIMVIKAGKFPESAEAALCHTGALCGEDAVYDAAFQRAGIVRVQAIGDLFSCAETLSMQPNPKGPKLTIVTNAGGPGIMATDSLKSRGGQLSQLSTKTVRALKEFLPPYCSNLNPIDILEEATTDRFGKVLNICFNDPNSDGFLVIYTPQGASDPVETAEAIVGLSKNLKKPILTCWMGEDDCWKARRVARKNGIPAFGTPEQAVSAFMYMWSYAQNLELLYETPEELPIELSIPLYLREVLRKAVDEDREVLTEPETSEFLHAYKIPTVKSTVATSLDAAVSAASKIGFPLAMKTLSSQIRHKMRAGGVFLDVRSEAEVRAIYQALARRFKTQKPSGELNGVILQSMVPRRGYEILVGAKRDPHFGSVILFGTGGIATELHRDVSIGLPPLNQVLARRLMEKTAIYRHFSDQENLRVSLKILEGTLIKFSQLVIDFPEIKEIIINPLIVDGDCIAAVDTRITVDKEKLKDEAQPHEHLVIAPYPKNYSFKWQLKDGRRVAIRPIRPEDEHLIDQLFQSFSEATMRFRFFQLVKEMSHDTLTRYCNIDYDREIAMIAEFTRGRRKIIGVSRLILQPDGRHGEFAVAVGDKWQGLGLGSKLVDTIIQIGKGIGLESIGGDVLTKNLKMIQLCRRRGFRIQQLDEELVKASLDLRKPRTNTPNLNSNISET